MFDLILEKYKKNMKNPVLLENVILIAIMVIGIILIIMNIFLELKWLFSSCLLLIAPICWIVAKTYIEEKKKTKKSMDELFKERNDKFKKFLEDNEICDNFSREWMKKKCFEKLKEENKQTTEYIMPFFSIVVIPIVLMFVKVLIDSISIEKSVQYIMLIVFLSMIVYLSGRALESNILQMRNQKIYYIKRLRDDLEIYEFFLNKSELKNKILRD